MFLLNMFKINVARNNEEKACKKTFYRKKVCAKLTHYYVFEVNKSYLQTTITSFMGPICVFLFCCVMTSSFSKR